MSSAQIAIKREAHEKVAKGSRHVSLHHASMCQHRRFQAVKRNREHRRTWPKQIAGKNENQYAQTGRQGDHRHAGPERDLFKLSSIVMPEISLVGALSLE